MSDTDLINILNELLKLPSETEVFEFKEAKNTFDFNKLGKYFSSLSNEANLKSKRDAWLIFGIRDNDRAIVGSLFRTNTEDLNNLKSEIANKTTSGITFIDIHEVTFKEKRVVMFQIPSAPRGFPVAWEGHYYGRDGQNLAPLNLEEIERIRNQTVLEDWSAGICEDATLDALDITAITKARENFKVKNPRLNNEVDTWDDSIFLDKAKITISGKITRSAIILMGKPESEHFISPAVARISWVLKTKEGIEKDYEHFSCPFLLEVENIFKKIRNSKYRYIRDETIFPEELNQYEPLNIREALNNCIAHQDYTLGGKINIVEREDDYLSFVNLGSFLPGSIEYLIQNDSPPEFYRNSFLCQAMVNLNMIDTIGSGIKRMFRLQRDRFFPMPEYDISKGKVHATLIGKVIDFTFAKTLANNPDLSLQDIFALDKIQKNKPLEDFEIKSLRDKKLIEGKKPNFYFSAGVAKVIDQKAEYSKNKAFDKQYYLDLIVKAIYEHGYLDRKDVDELLWKKLPEWMNDKQKKTKINHLLSELRINDVIRNVGSDSKPNWILVSEL